VVEPRGGGCLDTVPATGDAAWPPWVQAVWGKDVRSYLDGGIRRGSDVFNSTGALGPEAVPGSPPP